MLWFYTRGEEDLELVTRYDNRTAEYVLTVFWANGHHQEERFTVGSQFRARLLELEGRLAADRWAINGPPKFFAEGWPGKRPQ